MQIANYQQKFNESDTVQVSENFTYPHACHENDTGQMCAGLARHHRGNGRPGHLSCSEPGHATMREGVHQRSQEQSLTFSSMKYRTSKKQMTDTPVTFTSWKDREEKSLRPPDHKSQASYSASSLFSWPTLQQFGFLQQPQDGHILLLKDCEQSL